MPAVSIDAVFRSEWPRLVATLMRDFGDLELAEDCAQEAFLAASTRWEAGGEAPENPGAWLTTTARRKALDRVRRSASYQHKLRELDVRAKRGLQHPQTGNLLDDELALLLGCCHPSLNLEAQVALTLRLVAGLTTEQIAQAFLVEESAMSKRLTRAKAKIRNAGVPFGPVDRDVLRSRLNAVCHVIYLIFNEGHASTSEEEFVLDGYVYFHLAAAELLRRVERPAEAAVSYRRATECAPAAPQLAFIERRLASL